MIFPSLGHLGPMRHERGGRSRELPKGLNVLKNERILTDFFIGPEASTVTWLFLGLHGRTADTYRFDSA